MHRNTSGSLFSSKIQGDFGLEQIIHSVILGSFCPSFTGLLSTRFFVGLGCLVSKVNWLMQPLNQKYYLEIPTHLWHALKIMAGHNLKDIN